ncbi:MAG: tRNA pseudouridine38-40 synthase [Kiritimatiellia bacterium]|jgi:tRNA pseudouridine38-40 synthase
MVRWKLVLEYDGTHFVGWEVQPAQRSVQGAVEEALHQLLQHPVRVSVSGRTDSGVHAEGQVASFVTGAKRDARAIREGLNALLPVDVACIEAVVVPMSFDPRRQARIKHYRYRYLCRPSRSPLRSDRVWHLRHPLDDERMHQAVLMLAGTHDFSSFRAAGCGAKTTVRTLERWSVARVGDEVVLDAMGHGYLRHMLRIVAGTAYEIGRRRRPPEWMAQVLAARDRSAAGRTAPARGLTLIEVRYDSVK